MKHRVTAGLVAFFLLAGAVVRGEDLCSFLDHPGDRARPNPSSGQLRDAAVAQAKNIVFKSISKMGGSWNEVGEIGDAVDDAIIDPIVEAVTTQTSGTSERLDRQERADMLVRKFLEGAETIVFPALDVVVTGGRVVVAGVAFGVDELYAATNPGYDLRLANQMDFYAVEPQRGRGITEANIGEKVKTESALRDLWFKTYRWKVKDFLNKSEIDALLDDRWPTLLKTWQRSRASFVMRQLHDQLLAAIRALPARKGESPGAPPAEIFGFWKTPGGSVIVITSDKGGVLGLFCQVGEAARKLGLRRGDRLFWGGSMNAPAAREGRVVLYGHTFARAQSGDCPRLAPHDQGPSGMKLTWDRESDTMTVVEKTTLYHPKTCKWATVPSEPETKTWQRVSP